jgi:hypothetical protein
MCVTMARPGISNAQISAGQSRTLTAQLLVHSELLRHFFALPIRNLTIILDYMFTTNLQMRLFSLLLAVALAVSPHALFADIVPINGAAVAPNIAEIRVSDDGIRINLEIFVRDISVFDTLVPDSWYKDDTSTLPPLAGRLVEFAQSGLSVRGPDGDPLAVVAELIEARTRIDRASPLAGKRDRGTGQIVPAPPNDKRVLYAELFYPFGDVRPDQVTISPPLDEKGRLRVSIGMIVFDRDVPVIDFRFLSGQETLNIDWLDPWYSNFENPIMRRHYRFPILTFLYATPYEIRHEALIRVRTAAELVGVPLAGRTLSQAERKEIEIRLPPILSDRSPMTVDGKMIVPKFDNLSFMRIGTRGLNFLGDNDQILTEADFVGLIYSEPAAGYAQEATVEWTVFPKPVTKVPGSATDAAGPYLADLTPDDPVLTWVNYFKSYEPPVIAPVTFGNERTVDVPALTVLLIFLTLGIAVFLFRKQTAPLTLRIIVIGTLVVVTGVSTQFGRVTIVNPFAGIPDKLATTRITSQLIENSHKALREKIPKRLDEALNVSISKNSFEDVKEELSRALLIEMQGGGVGTVDGIRNLVVTNTAPASGGKGFLATVSWSATASGNHWGHPHQKNIRFSALMDVTPVDGVWKLTGITVTSAKPEV